MPQVSSGEWHTGEVVSLCESYGFIRISKDRKSDDIFVERVAAEPPVATIDGVAATLNRLQLDAAGTSPLANLTAEQKAAIRAAVVAAKTPAELDALERQLRSRCRRRPSASATKKIKPSARSWRGSGR